MIDARVVQIWLMHDYDLDVHDANSQRSHMSFFILFFNNVYFQIQDDALTS